MLETTDLILDKAKFSDWEGLYRNVWSRPESARHMLWNLTTREENTASVKLAQSLGFTLIGSKPKTDARNGYPYNVLEYSLKL